MRLIMWTGVKNRPVKVQRPCACGCDSRISQGAGYLSGSNRVGKGFSLFVDKEEDYQALAKVFGESDANTSVTGD